MSFVGRGLDPSAAGLEGRPPYIPHKQYAGRGDLTLPRASGDAAPTKKTPIGATSDGGYFLQITA